MLGEARLAPVEALLHQTAVPIQLQVQTKDALLKPGMGKQGNILLPTLEGLERGLTVIWTWPWEIKDPTYVRWPRVERNLQIVPWVIGTWPPVLKVIYPGPADHEILLRGTFVISLWPIMSSALLLQVDAEPSVEA